MPSPITVPIKEDVGESRALPGELVERVQEALGLAAAPAPDLAGLSDVDAMPSPGGGS